MEREELLCVGDVRMEESSAERVALGEGTGVFLTRACERGTCHPGTDALEIIGDTGDVIEWCRSS